MVTNRVYKVLVSNGVEGASLASATAGQFLILKKDGTKFAAADTITAGDEFTIAVKQADGSILSSDKIKVKDITSFEKQAYRAKAEQVVTVTIATPVVGKEYSLSVIDVSDKEILPHRQNKRSYSVLADDAETATTLATKFRDKINADSASVVSASGTGASVVLTAKSNEIANLAGEYPSQYVFEVFLNQVDHDSYQFKFGTVAYTTAPDAGSGRFVQIRKLEQNAQGYLGVTNRTKWPVEAGLYQAVPGTNYDVYVIEAERKYDSNSATFGQVESPVSIIVAITAGATAAFEAILDPYIASAPNEGIAVEG